MSAIEGSAQDGEKYSDLFERKTPAVLDYRRHDENALSRPTKTARSFDHIAGEMTDCRIDDAKWMVPAER